MSSVVKGDPRYTENLFRPMYEVNIAMCWLIGGIATPLLSTVYSGGISIMLSLYVGLFMIVVGVHYVLKALPLLKRQMTLHTDQKTFISTEDLRKFNYLTKRYMGTDKEKKADRRETYIGDGFKWGSEHANRAFQIMQMDTDYSQVKLPWVVRAKINRQLKKTPPDDVLGGFPWIHGLGDETPQFAHEATWYGHLLITGQVGSGKTTLLRLLSVNALHLGNVLVVLDPKNDTDWRDAIKNEMEYLGMGDKFYYLHPASPSKSCRIPLLKNFTRLSDIPARVAPLMGGGASGKPFQNFAFEAIYAVVSALHYLNEPIRLTTVGKVIRSDKRGVAMRVVDKYYRETVGEEYMITLANELKDMGLDNGDPLQVLADYYRAHLSKDHQNNVVDLMVSFGLHPDEHYTRMVTTLKPIFTALTAEPLDKLFSPVDEDDIDDPRPIVDPYQIMETGGCLYISLDSLSDSITASFIARLVLAELAAVAGDRYNRGDKNVRRVTIANDEVHSSIENNDALLNMMAQGRAASMQMMLATQNVADLTAKTDEATANRFLGLCNNFVSMRTSDPETQRYMATQFSKASIENHEVRTGTNRDTEGSLFSFGTGYQESITRSWENAFPEQLLGELPKLQYVARLANGEKLKMRLPVLLNKDKPGEVAPWLS